MQDRVAIAVQFTIATAIGLWTYSWLLADGITNPKVLVFGPLLFGFGGLWATMYLWTWIRHGRESAKSLSMDPD